MTDEKIRERGWSVVIYRAVQLAGGPQSVSEAMGLSRLTPMNWYKSGNINAQYINGLCSLGGNRITPAEILAEVERAAAERRAA